ncbi:hypothetical protein TNCV_1814401 [Trichonephila clavipes]|nr:hypothetical protein TNCV_1814401 [Trichonephila clavipes]
MLPGSSTTALFHGCGSHLKLLECVVDGKTRSIATPAEDRYIVLSAKRNRRTRENYTHADLWCCPIDQKHRTARLQWCREHHNWAEQDWACVLFSDESRFSLSSDCVDAKSSGTAYRPENRKGPISDMQYHDLNPIENVWDALGRQVAGRNYPPTNKNTLIFTEEWDKLPQQLLDNVVQSMVRRVECCITLHGGHIRTDTI